MEIPKALELIRKAVEEIPHLKGLNHKNDEFQLWRQKLEDILEAAFGKESGEYLRFTRAVTSVNLLRGSESHAQQEYVEHLTKRELAVKSILQKYETLGTPSVSTATATSTPPIVFIAHGGESEALSKLCEFLEAVGTEPVVVEKAPSQGRSVNENVEWCLDRADCAIILATKGDIDSKSGDFLPRGNVLIEVGRCQERFAGKVVYLLENNARFPSNISEMVWERFTQDNMEGSFIKVARELVAFGLVKAVRGH